MVRLKERISASWGKIQAKVRTSSKDTIEAMTLPLRRYPTKRLSTSFYTKNIMVVTSTTVDYDEAPNYDEAPKEPRSPECVVCMEESPADQLIYFCPPSPSEEASDSNPSNAGHGYCDGCLVQGIRTATKDRYPFRCCGKIFDTKDYTGATLSSEEKQAYEDMIEEIKTPNPLYCSNPRCSSFIKPALIKSDLGHCPKCSASTCKHCRQPYHPRLVCKQDQDTLKVLALGKEQGWKLCPVCGYMVELVKGCHIIRCKCAWSFCYRCGASNQSSSDDRRHTWHTGCWRPSDYALAVDNRPPEEEQLRRRRHRLDILGRIHDGWRNLARVWELELERERLRQRERARELEIARKLERLVHAELNPHQPAAKNNSNNNNHNQQARAMPQQNAQPHQQPRQEPRNPPHNRERGNLWRRMMVSPTRPVSQQPQPNPRPNHTPEPRGQKRRRSL